MDLSTAIRRDFPRTLIQFAERFLDEKACREYLMSLKWPDGFVCPKLVPDPNDPEPDVEKKRKVPCGCRTYWIHERKDLWICTDCQHQTSLRVGTVFEHSKKSLRDWFFAIFHVTNSKQGISALELKNLMGFGCYKTAWTWLHKLRGFMHPTEDEGKLTADVELDDLNFGGALEGGKRGRGAENKIKVLVAVERLGRRCGKVRFKVVPAHNGAEIERFVRQWIEPGAMLHTDGMDAFERLAVGGYVMNSVTTNDHGKAIRGRGGKKLAELQIPKAHRVIAKVKLLIGGTHQNRFSGKHLQRYLEEYAYRFDRRDSKVPGLMFQVLARRLACAPPPRYWQIVGRSDYKTPLAKREKPFWIGLGDALDADLG